MRYFDIQQFDNIFFYSRGAGCGRLAAIMAEWLTDTKIFSWVGTKVNMYWMDRLMV